MNLNKCLEKYVGLSQSRCKCKPEELRYFRPYSSIGLYLDSERYSVPLNFIGTKEDCDSGGIIRILADARKRGISEFISIISRAVKDKFGYNDLPVSFFIGRQNENGSLNITETYKGVEIRPSTRYRSGVITIRGIYLKGNKGDDFVLRLFRVGEDKVYREVGVENYDGGKIEVNWTLPMTDNGRAIEWRIIGNYEEARNHALKGCCGSGRPSWMNYMSVIGIASENEDGEGGREIKGNPSGMRLDASFHCGHMWLCDNNNDQDGLGRQIGEGVYLMSVIELLSFIENRPHPYTPAPVEYIQAKKDDAWSQLMIRVDWIIDNAGERLSGCADCSNQKLRKAPILL